MKRNTEVSVRQRDVTHAGKKYTECYSVDEQMTIQRYIKLVQQLAKGLEDNSQAEKMHIERMEEMSLKKMEMEVKLEHARIEHREKMRFLDMPLELNPSVHVCPSSQRVSEIVSVRNVTPIRHLQPDQSGNALQDRPPHHPAALALWWWILICQSLEKHWGMLPHPPWLAFFKARPQLSRLAKVLLCPR